MPVHSPAESPQIKILRQALAQHTLTLEKNFPSVRQWLDNSTIDVIDSVDTAIIKELQTEQPRDQLPSQISLEEITTIIQKMTELTQLPPGILEKQSQLYLEQQLSDLFGFEVTASLDDHSLPFHNGVMAALPHLKRFHTDTLEQHRALPEAGMASRRGAFGWLPPEKEAYYVSLPLQYQTNEQKNFQKYTQWFAHCKVIVINPIEKKAVVAVIGTVLPFNLLKYQYGGSPELIREGLIWSPLAQGKMLLFFVDDPQDQVPLGPIDFTGIVPA